MSMRAFVEVARRGSFGAAAEQLGMSRAMVTRHVAHLETGLGVRLLNRTTRRLSLTSEGQAYLERCLQILEEIEEADLAVGRAGTCPRGTLRVTAPTSFGTHHLAPAIAAYQQAYPEVTVGLVLSDRRIDLAEEGIDVAVRVGPLEDSQLVARRLAATGNAVCAAPSYLRARGEPRTPADLAAHNCLRYTYRSPNWLFERDGHEVAVTVHGDFECNVGDALREAALAGRGIALLPMYMVGADLEHGLLRRLLEDYRLPQVPIHALYLHRRHLSAKVRTFVDFLAERFACARLWAQP